MSPKTELDLIDLAKRAIYVHEGIRKPDLQDVAIADLATKAQTALAEMEAFDLAMAARELTNCKTAAEMGAKLLTAGFNQFAPHTYLYHDERDTITVYVLPSVVIVTGDGPEVIPTYNVLQVRERDHDWEDTLQLILSKI